jgi:purine-binding chemotaxis protein CheW
MERPSPRPPSASAPDKGGQYLTFSLGAEDYAIDILKVQEITSYSPVTPIPNAPPHVLGFMNLRGTIVPVLGLRERFGMPSVEYGKFTVIVVLALGEAVIGLVVDAVSDVLPLPAADVGPIELAGAVDTSFVSGLARASERLIILLDVDRLVADVGAAAHRTVQ